jgi:hypothetical protein
MTIRASDPPMKLRLLMESDNLKACLSIYLSDQALTMREFALGSTNSIDKASRKRCQHKLLIVQ